MRYSKVYLEALGYELAPNVVASAALEERLAPLYQAFGMQTGQLEALTGIRQRRWWDPGFALSEGALRAGRKALAAGGLPAEALGALIYAGVCREASEPATACAVAAGLGVRPDCAVYDISNACLGVMNGVFEVANAIELGAMRAGLIVSCESAREINDSMIESMLRERTLDHFRLSLATLTGGSGAAAVLLTDGSFRAQRRRLLGGVLRAAPEHHRLCRWHRDSMSTDAAAVLKHGVGLGRATWQALLAELGWTADSVDKTVCHQVGAPHRSQVLAELGVPESKDFQTYEHLGNMGTVSLPVTAAIAEEREFISPGDRVAFLGIGSGLNCLMLGWQW